MSTFSHEQIFRLMQDYLVKNIVANDISKKDEVITCEINHQPHIILTPVGIKQTPTLEKMIKENTSKNITTTVIFPKSSSFYEGNYMKNGGAYLYHTNGEDAWHPTARLSQVEQFLCDNYASIIPYFNPKNKSIETIRFRKLPEKVLAHSIGFLAYGENEFDEEIMKKALNLKEIYGKGHSYKINPTTDKIRYIELSRIKDKENIIREKYIREEIKGEFTIKGVQKKGLLIGKIIYSPQVREVYQPSLFI